jgi:methylthioribose-1-phosphate isomerase
VLVVGGVKMAPEGSAAWNPAFDVTPADLVTAVVTEERVWRLGG